MSDSGFPNLTPFATVLANIDVALPVGNLSSGGSLNFVRITSGTFKSEDGSINASFVHGADWIHADPDGKHLRLDVHSVMKTDDDNVPIDFSYTGLLTITPEIGAVLSGSKDAKTTSFGNVFSVPKFRVGDPKYKVLENSVFVGGGRFVVTDIGVAVEYKISKLVG